MSKNPQPTRLADIYPELHNPQCGEECFYQEQRYKKSLADWDDIPENVKLTLTQEFANKCANLECQQLGWLTSASEDLKYPDEQNYYHIHKDNDGYYSDHSHPDYMHNNRSDPIIWSGTHTPTWAPQTRSPLTRYEDENNEHRTQHVIAASTRPPWPDRPPKCGKQIVKQNTSLPPSFVHSSTPRFWWHFRKWHEQKNATDKRLRVVLDAFIYFFTQNVRVDQDKNRQTPLKPHYDFKKRWKHAAKFYAPEGDLVQFVFTDKMNIPVLTESYKKFYNSIKRLDFIVHRDRLEDFSTKYNRFNFKSKGKISEVQIISGSTNFKPEVSKIYTIERRRIINTLLEIEKLIIAYQQIIGNKNASHTWTPWSHISKLTGKNIQEHGVPGAHFLKPPFNAKYFNPELYNAPYKLDNERTIYPTRMILQIFINIFYNRLYHKYDDLTKKIFKLIRSRPELRSGYSKFTNSILLLVKILGGESKHGNKDIVYCDTYAYLATALMGIVYEKEDRFKNCSGCSLPLSSSDTYGQKKTHGEQEPPHF